MKGNRLTWNGRSLRERSEHGQPREPATYGTSSVTRFRFLETQKIVIAADVVRLLVWPRREHEADGAGGEVDDLTPDAGIEIKAEGRAVQRHRAARPPIVDNDVERSETGDDQLLKLAMRVAAASLPARHVVKVVDALQRERNVLLRFDVTDVSARSLNARQFDHTAVIDRRRGRVDIGRRHRCRGNSRSHHTVP